MIRMGIIGLGHWGPNYLRNFRAMENVEVGWCCDLLDENLSKAREFPEMLVTKNYEEVLNDRSTGAVVVATPATTHYKIVKESLNAGKDVLAEKPLTLEPTEALELCELAEEQKRILMVGHTFIYNPGIRKVKEIIDEGELGQIYYLNATRTHLGLIRDDVNAIWDLAPHDISIANYLLGETPVGVNAVGACYLREGREDVGFINLIYPNKVIANIHASWADSNKERTVRVVGSKARVVFNDLDNLERVKIYKKGIRVSEKYDDFGGFQLNLRDGDIISPVLKLYEPLSKMCSHFVGCVESRERPITDGYSGYEVVKVMKDVEKSIHMNGQIAEWTKT